MLTDFRDLGGKKCWGGVVEMLLGLGWQNIFGMGGKILLGCVDKIFPGGMAKKFWWCGDNFLSVTWQNIMRWGSKTVQLGCQLFRGYQFLEGGDAHILGR